MNQPLVSIVAINYNNEKYVIETLDSIANQTYQNTELIIVDDCSTDSSPLLIENWLKNYKKPYHFIKHVKNLGVCKTINDGYKVAIGKYIESIATDDIMMPEKTEKQVGILEKSLPSVGMVYSNVYLIDEFSCFLNISFINMYRKDLENFPSGNIYNEILKGNFIPAMSIMIKSEILNEIGYFDENLNYEDYDMWLRIAKKFNIVYSGYISAKYRIRRNSLSETLSKQKWILDDIKIYDKHRLNSVIAKDALNSLIKKSFYNNLRNVYLLIKFSSNKFENGLIFNIWSVKFLPHKLKVKIYNLLIKILSKYYKCKENFNIKRNV